jgi:hypothetical protein
MKEIYSFNVEREIESSKPVIKKTKNGSIESFEKTTKKVNHRVVFVKPHMSKIEEAEFFYGQKFNEYINSGFLTKAMLNKKMGDIGGLSSKVSVESLQKAIVDNIEASRVIEFYGSSKDLTEEQKNKLEEAKLTFASTQAQVSDYERAIRSQFSQTADVKAEQKLIEWLIFHLSFYEEDVDGKKELFPIFEGDSFDDKRYMYLELCEKIEDMENHNLYKVKSIFDKSFETLARVASIWYNKIAENQEDIDKALKDMFGDKNLVVEENEKDLKSKKSKKEESIEDGQEGTAEES